METLIWVLLIVLLYLFFFWDPKSQYDIASDKKQSIAPNIIQAVIEAIQKDKPDEVPLETLFVNVQPDGSYNSRFMFYNTKHFYGTQYDVNAKVGQDGSVEILKIGDSAQIDPTAGYKPDKYQPWVDVQSNLDAQFKGALVGYKNQPPQPNLTNLTKAYGQNMILAESNLMTRS